MKDLLVIYNANWADEIDVAGSRLFTTAEWEELVAMAQMQFKQGGTLTHHIGTNEDIEFESFEEWFECYKLMPLNKAVGNVEAINELYSDYTFASACEEQFYYPEDFDD